MDTIRASAKPDEWLSYHPVPRQFHAGETVSIETRKSPTGADVWRVVARNIDGRVYAARVYSSLAPAAKTARAWATMQGNPIDDFEGES